MKRTAFFILTCYFFISNIYSQNAPDDAISLAKSIKTESFFTHLGILSSDAFEGRQTGSKGYNMAADYVVGEIRKLGLKPGGINGTYFQPIAFESREIEKSSVEFMFKLDNKVTSGEFGMDIAILPNNKDRKVNANHDVVFLGYGLEIPELGINDFKGVDVKGKTVIICLGLPDNIDKKKYRKYINPLERIKILEEKGASGLIIYTNLGILQNLIFNQVNKFFSEPWFDFQDADLTNPMIGNGSSLLVYSKKEFIKEVFTFNGLSFKETKRLMEKGEFKSFALKSGLEVNYTASAKSIPCKNIVAILPGSDPDLSSEYVVLSAHLDHLGIGKTIKKDSIYNGAWDNASGSSTLLAMAETYKQMPVAPKRSVIFLWVTAEEKGLMGSHYYARKPTVPQNKIVADMSLDMPGGLFEAKSIIPMGYKMSNLSEAVDFAAGGLNLAKDTSSSEENEYFERSDHFSFVSAGIPSLFLFGGMDAVDPYIHGQKTYDKWDKKVYHSPFDDMNQNFSKEAFLQGIQVNFLISWFIANEMDEVRWKKESAQYKKYILK